MTARDLISALQVLIDDFGDLEVTTEDFTINHMLENDGTFLLTE